jgi:ABC-type lipoprotein export system ATPase subunit
MEMTNWKFRQENGDIVFDIFKTLTQEFNQTILIVTHDIDFASKTDRIINEWKTAGHFVDKWSAFFFLK